MFANITKTIQRISQYILSLDWKVFLVMIVLTIIGIANNYSSSLVMANETERNARLWNQGYFIILGFILMLLLPIFDYKWLKEKSISILLYLIGLILLVAVFFQPDISYVHRWIVIGNTQIQVSEIAKIIIIIVSSFIYTKIYEKLNLEIPTLIDRKFLNWFERTILYIREHIGIFALLHRDIPHLRYILLLFLLTVFYAALIFLEPSGGVALTLMIIFFINFLIIYPKRVEIIIFFANILVLSNIYLNIITIPTWLRSALESIYPEYIYNLLGLNISLWLTLITSGAIVYLFWITKKYWFINIVAIVIGLSLIPLVVIFWHSDIVNDYQKQRLMVYVGIGEESLLKDKRYQQNQAIAQISSGGLTGKGYLQGTKSGIYLTPETTTDFAFVNFAEEFGIIGTALYLIMILLLVYLLIQISEKATDWFAKFMIIGFAVTIFVVTILPILINTGIMFNTGLPSPFLSFGGSFTIGIFAMVGLSLSISKSRKKYLY